MIKYVIGQPSMIEHNDCMVRALSNVLDKPYYEVHSALLQLGRKPRRATKWAVCVKAMLAYGVGVAAPLTRGGMTHAEFMRQHPKGKFIAISRQHAWAIKDGIAYDSWKPGPRMRIRAIGVIS